MGRFFLFALLTWITGNPLLAILVIIALSLPGWWAGSRYAWRLSRRMRAWGEAGRLRRALAVNPHDVKARTDLGAILVRQGRFREARAELEQAMPRADDLPEANYALGLCLLHDGEIERGRELVERALVLNPKFGYGEPYLRLGDFRTARDEWEQAAERYRQATGIHSSSVEGWFKLGQALNHLGRRDEARSALQEAIASYRTAPWYQRAEARPWHRRARRLLRSLG
ncbi:MAG: tetratricopeptide repeat protein [candidate division NC10 bacterium]|nr:tetratricopeptide repeat protein [candidate division NC10 bacterium]